MPGPVVGSGSPPYEHCHAGGEEHGLAYHRGAFGWLCWACWVAVYRIVKRDQNVTPPDDRVSPT